MHIVCPTCAAAYDVPEAKLAGRRSLRCARCGVSWSLEPPPPPVATAMPAPPNPPAWQPPPPEPAPIAAWNIVEPTQHAPYPDTRIDPPPLSIGRGFSDPEPPAAAWSPPPPPPGYAESLPSGWELKLAWAGSIAVVLGIVTAVLLGHDSVAATWPPAERLFAALGLGNS